MPVCASVQQRCFPCRPLKTVCTILTCAGSPRAYNIPDRFHPEEDGADPRTRQTVLQQHVEFFDYVSHGDKYSRLKTEQHTPCCALCGPCFWCVKCRHKTCRTGSIRVVHCAVCVLMQCLVVMIKACFASTQHTRCITDTVGTPCALQVATLLRW